MPNLIKNKHSINKNSFIKSSNVLRDQELNSMTLSNENFTLEARVSSTEAAESMQIFFTKVFF